MSDTYQAIYDAVRSRIHGGNVGEILQEAMRGSFDISHAVEGIKSEICYAADGYTRPSVMFKPKLGRDGNAWIALYGDNLQEGVVGCGDSPSDAMHDFDKAWYAKIGSTGEGK